MSPNIRFFKLPSICDLNNDDGQSIQSKMVLHLRVVGSSKCVSQIIDLQVTNKINEILYILARVWPVNTAVQRVSVLPR